MSCSSSSSVDVWPSPAAQPKAKCVKAEIHIMWRCGGLTSADHSLIQPISCSPLFQFFFSISWEALSFCFEKQRKRDIRALSPSNSPFFCSLSSLIYGLSEISNAWETSTSRLHLLLLPVPSQSHFLNRLSSGMRPSPVLCQAGRVVLWGQTKGWLSSRPVSLSPNRHHGSVGRRYQTWFWFKQKITHGLAGSQEDNSWWLNRTEPQYTSFTPTQREHWEHQCPSCAKTAFICWPENVRKWCFPLSA